MTLIERVRQWLASAPTVNAQNRASEPIAPADAADAGDRLILDVRSEREFMAGALRGAVNVPLNQLAARIAAVAPQPGTPLVLYCASGGRSGIACQLLKQLGYSNVSNAGGLYAASARLGIGLR